ncbi:MAG: hypothetical protein ABL927_08820 [Bdellovibrionales bacterium]
MRLYLIIITILAIFIHRGVWAKTLIVTHADSRYDENSSAGPRTKFLLEQPFTHKILLVNPKGGLDRLTFDKFGLEFESRKSEEGEIKWNDSDSEITLSGGYFEACFINTLHDILTQSKKNLRIRVDMSATYDFLDNFVQNPSRYNSNYTQSTVLNLNEIAQMSGDMNLKMTILAKLYYQVGKWMKNQELNETTIYVQLKRKKIAEIGEGFRSVQLDFE